LHQNSRHSVRLASRLLAFFNAPSFLKANSHFNLPRPLTPFRRAVPLAFGFCVLTTCSIFGDLDGFHNLFLFTLGRSACTTFTTRSSQLINRRSRYQIQPYTPFSKTVAGAPTSIFMISRSSEFVLSTSYESHPTLPTYTTLELLFREGMLMTIGITTLHCAKTSVHLIFCN